MQGSGLAGLLIILFWCGRRNIPALGVNTMLADALATLGARASAGMELAV